MASAEVDVIGSSPLSFTNSDGGQQVVPLSALKFSGSEVQLKTAWKAALDAGEQATLLALAKAKAAAGELTPPPVPPPAPALAFTAKQTGVEGNHVTVTSVTETGKPPLTAKITLSATRTDSYPALADGPAAAHKLGVDAPTGTSGDPLAGTGLVVVKQGSTGASTKPPVASSGVLVKNTGVDLKDADNKVVCTLLPRADYAGKGGLSYEVTVSGATFTIAATYDSTKEDGTQDPVTLLTLDKVAAPVGYLVKVSAPPRGAALPADSSATLSGGGPGLAATGLIYTS